MSVTDLTPTPYPLSPKRVLTFLVTVSLLLVAASLFGQYLRYFHGRGSAFGFIENFDVESEANFPTYYSTMLLVVAALLLSLIAWIQRMAGDPMARRWSLLALIFFVLSLDETIGFHELIGKRLPYFYYWTIPAATAVVVVGLYFLPFLWKLPGPHRSRFVGAGAVYVGGALGVEVVEAAIASQTGDETWTYVLVATAQEFMEMLGISIFIWALLKYIESRAPVAQGSVRISDS